MRRVGIDELGPEYDDLLEEIKDDFSAVVTSRRPACHLESPQIRRARKPILLQDRVAMELSELHKGDNVLFIRW